MALFCVSFWILRIQIVLRIKISGLTLLDLEKIKLAQEE